MFIGDSARVLRGKNPNRNEENEVSMTCYTPYHCVVKLVRAQFHCNFPLFHCLESSADVLKCLFGSSFCRMLLCIKILVFV